LPLIFRSEKKFLWPSWRTLNLILFYNSRQSFTENQALMWLFGAKIIPARRFYPMEYSSSY
ncbi:unnamed protein product, partial [Oikopleura dioica]